MMYLNINTILNLRGRKLISRGGPDNFKNFRFRGPEKKTIHYISSSSLSSNRILLNSLKFIRDTRTFYAILSI